MQWKSIGSIVVLDAADIVSDKHSSEKNFLKKQTNKQYRLGATCVIDYVQMNKSSTLGWS